MQLLKKYWLAILIIAVLAYLLWKSMKPKTDAGSEDTGTYIESGGILYPSRPITDAMGNVPTPQPLGDIPTRG